MILFKQFYWLSCCHLTFRKIWYCLIKITLIWRFWLDEISHYLYVHWSNRNRIHMILFIDFVRKRKWNQVNWNNCWVFLYRSTWCLSTREVIITSDIGLGHYHFFWVDNSLCQPILKVINCTLSNQNIRFQANVGDFPDLNLGTWQLSTSRERLRSNHNVWSKRAMYDFDQSRKQIFVVI
jgi:hypothetical protein